MLWEMIKQLTRWEKVVFIMLFQLETKVSGKAMFSRHHSKTGKLETILSQVVLAVEDYTETRVKTSNGNVRLTLLVSSVKELRQHLQSSMRLQDMTGKTKNSMAIHNTLQLLKREPQIL
jgi:hypothetical protein